MIYFTKTDNKRVTKRAAEGFVLIVVVGVLAALVLTATVFIINNRYKLKAAESFSYQIKARYLVDAALNKAIAELRYGSEGAASDAVDLTTEAWAMNEPYTISSIDLGGGLSGEVKVLTITDCASRINVNSSNPDLGAMLTSLNGALGSPLSNRDITQILNNSPFDTKTQIRATLLPEASHKNNQNTALLKTI